MRHVSLYQRPRSPYWYFVITEGGKRYRGSTRLTDHGEALSFVNARALDLEKQPTGATINDLLDAVIEDMTVKQRRGLRNAKSQISHLRAALGEMRHGEVSRTVISDYQRARLKRVSPRTVDIELAHLKRAFRLADLRPPRIEPLVSVGENARQGFLEPKEIKRLLKAIEDPDLVDFFEFIFVTGRRVGEVASYRWDDVHGDILTIRPEINKTKRPETLPLVGVLGDIFRRRRAAKNDTGLVFHGRGGRLSKIVGGLTGWAQDAFLGAAKRIKRPNLRPHDARRSATRNMIRKGGSQSVVMKITGHRTESIFRRYNITSEKDQRNLISSL